MTVREIKDWINNLPEEWLEFETVNGEIGELNDKEYYRVDKPILTAMVDIENKTVLFLNDLADPIDNDDIR